MRKRDKSKQKIYQQKWYEKHKVIHIKNVAKNRKKYKEEIQKLINKFREDGCLICGEASPCCLDAHHKEDSEKDFNIGGCKNSVSVGKVKKELNKCICLCANCHRKLHYLLGP